MKTKKYFCFKTICLIFILSLAALMFAFANPAPVSAASGNDFDILDQFGADSPHAQMLVCEHARSLADFGAAPAGHRRNGSVVGSDRSYVDPHGGEYIMTYVGKEYAGQTYLIDGKPYEVCEHGYAVDPIYEKGGYLFTPLYRDEVNLYMIAMDFDDLRGDNYAPYGVQRSVLINNGAVYDLTYPQVIYNMTYHGNKGLTALPDHIFKGEGTVTDGAGIGVVERLQMMSMGRLKVNAICLNEEYAKLHPEMDAVNDKWPWFRAESAMMSYCTQGPAECEDYRQFSRIHQGGVDAAMRTLTELREDVLAGKWLDTQIQAGTGYQDKAALAVAIKKVMDDFENVDSVYTPMPPTTHGYGYGWQAGSGIATAFGYNDQSQVLRDTEYRHEFEARTPGGRMLGGGVFGTMNLTRDFSRIITTWMHEFGHTYGFIDDYSYGNMGTNNGESSSAGSAGSAWSIMGDNNAMRSGPDLPAWRKFRLGWLAEEEVLMILPGEKKKVAILALSAQGDPGAYDAALAGELAKLGYAPGEVDFVGARLVAIPKEYRTRDTFGVVWDNGWNPNRTAYNWYDWFINQWAGGETYAIKSFPTFYTLECRKPIGVDKYVDQLRLQYSSSAGTVMGTEGGIVIDYVANSTWETGHGAGGFKGVSGNIPLRKSGTDTWADQNIGLSVTILETAEFFDVVEIEYAAAPQRDEARHVFLGALTASDNYVERAATFAVDFAIFTFGGPNTNDGTAAPGAPTRVATPLGVQGGLAGFTMTVEFDPAALDYWPAGNALPEGWPAGDFNVDTSNIGSGKLIVKAAGNRAIDKDTIISLGFAAKANAAFGEYDIKGILTDVVLHNWRGEVVKKGDPGFNGTAGGSAVGTIGDGTFAAFHAPNTLTLSSEDIKSSGGKVTVGANPTYTVSGRIVCEVPGPLFGLIKQSDGSINKDNYTGVESVVILYDENDKVVATSKSEYKGYFCFDGIPNGAYYVTAKKPRYDLGTSPKFQVNGANIIIGSNEDGVKGTIAIPPLMRERYTISGVIKGSPHSDGSNATPLAGVDVYLVNIGAAYEIMGGPVKTDALGQFTVEGLESFHPYASVAVSVKGTLYEDKYIPQIHLYPHMNKPFFGITEKLELSLGLNYGESGQDYRYPEGDVQLNAYGGSRRYYLNPGGVYNIKLTENVSDRNVTLVETQDVRLRIATKSSAITYQLRDMAGNPVGAVVNSLGNNNGDDLIRNVPPGEYYIEANRPGYISGCTMPFLVHGTRIMLRQSQTNNTMDLLAEDRGNIITGKVVDSTTGKSIEGAAVVCIPYNAGFGKGLPISTASDGAFSYTVVTGAKDIVITHPGYATKTIYVSSGGADLEKIELLPMDGIAVNFPGVKGVTLQYYSAATSWVTVPGVFDNTGSFSRPAGVAITSVQAVKDGMYHQFNGLVLGNEPLILDIPVKTISVIGIAAACDLAIVQDNWVYPYAPAAAGVPNEFNVFDNGKKYEARLYRTGFYPISIPGIEAGQTVNFGPSYFYQVTVPLGVTDVWISSYDWAVRGANAGAKITLLKDPGNIRDGKLRYVYEGVTYNIDIKLDGANPFGSLADPEATIPMDAYFNENWQLFQPAEQVEIEVEVGGRAALRAFYFTTEHDMYSTNVYGDDNGRGGHYTPPTGDIAAYNAQGQLTGMFATGNRVDFQWYTAKIATNDPAKAEKLLYNYNDATQGFVISNVHEVDTSAHFLGTNYYFIELTHTAPGNIVNKYYSAPVKVTVLPFGENSHCPPQLMTPAEASGWRLTTTSTELVAYYKELVKQSGGRMQMQPTGWQTLGRAAAPAGATNVNANLYKPSPPQDIPVVIISDPAFPVTGPADVGDRVVALISGGPHSGECEGKEAAMLFAREAALGRWDDLLKDLVIMILPSTNLEGNDILFAQRQSGQYLPKLVGARFTGGVLNPLIGAEFNPTSESHSWYNLNRDMVKLDTPEARVLTDIFNTWDPVLFMDLHGINGMMMLHAQTWNAGLHPDTDPELLDYNRYAFADLAVGKDSYLYKKQGKTARLYGVNWRNDANHYRDSDNCEPRYTTNYVGLRNRLALLLECYSHDPYPVRTDTQYGSIVGSMQAVQKDKAKIVQMLADTDAWARGRAERGIDPNDPRDRVTLRGVLPTLNGPEYAADPTLIREMELEAYRTNEVSGAILSQAINDPAVRSLGITAAAGDRVGTLMAGLPATLYKANDRRYYVPAPDGNMPGSVIMGAYYLFDKDCVGAAEILTQHGIEFSRLTKDITIAAEYFQWFNATLRRVSNTYYEGRLLNSPSGGQTAGQVAGWVGNWATVTEAQRIPAGTYVVSTAQPLGNLAALMLEPGCMDGLLSWTYSAAVQNPIQINFFDDCLDKKEGTIRYNYKSDSGEDYVPIFKISSYNAINPDETNEITVSFPGIKAATMQYYTNVCGWQTVGVFDDACSFEIPQEHKATWGITTLRLVKDGMYATFTFTLDQVNEVIVWDVPLAAITITGVTAECNLAIVQNDWVYRYTPAAVGAVNVFLVFDNDKKYEIWLQKPAAAIISITEVSAGQTVDISSYFE